MKIILNVVRLKPGSAPPSMAPHAYQPNRAPYGPPPTGPPPSMNPAPPMAHATPPPPKAEGELFKKIILAFLSFLSSGATTSKTSTHLHVIPTFLDVF